MPHFWEAPGVGRPARRRAHAFGGAPPRGLLLPGQ
jgi:hypothetical protein